MPTIAPNIEYPRLYLEAALKALLADSLRRYNYLFLEPIPLHHFPDYPDYIKDPMDLGTIKRRVSEGYYDHDAPSSSPSSDFGTISTFWCDVLRTFSNARVYNARPTNTLRPRDRKHVDKSAAEMTKKANACRKKVRH